MLIVRVFAAAAKPALIGGALSAAAVGGFFAVDRFHHDGPVSAFQQVQGHGQRLLISEFGDRSDTIVAVDPADVSQRTIIANIDHAEGFGVFPVLSPDGRAIAYTALPADLRKPAPDAPALAAVVGTDGKATVLADDVDLLVPPVWAPDSASFVVRKNSPGDSGAGSFELLLLGRDGARSSITTWTTAAVFPIAFAPDGSKLYFGTLNSGGSDLYSIAPDGSAETKVAHLADQIARDWKLSPDGATLAYSVAESGATPSVVTKTLDLASGVAGDAVAAAGARTEFNPAWNSDGRLAIASLKPSGGGDAVSVGAAGDVRSLTTNTSSIDLPLGWSPDGASLAVRAVSGSTPLDAGEGHVELVDGAGRRARVSDDVDVLIVGWLR
jgi:Tol biopolymer transport system component